MKLRPSRRGGFTLVEIMIVVAIIGMLSAIALPNMVSARTRSQRNACINNLRIIDGAIQQWALESNAPADAEVEAANLVPYLRGAAMPTCPTGDVDYEVTFVNEPSKCTSGVADHVL